MTSTSSVISQRIGSEVKCKLKFVDVVEKRALGLKNYQFAHDDLVALKLYNNFYQYQINKFEHQASFGGIFNLEFSLDG